ncbi:EamA family transporter [bacterium]|nr:EamA family transporter [bacterium]
MENPSSHSLVGASRLAVGTAVAFVVLTWGSAFVGIRDAIQSYSPWHLALLRYGVASVVMAVLALFRGVRIPSAADFPRLFLTGLFGIGIYNCLLNWGEQVVSAGSASLLVNTLPILTTVLSIIFLGERIDRVGWLGMLISFAGVTLIALGEGGRLSLEPRALVILVAAFCSAIYLVLQKPLLERYTSLECVSWAIWTGTAVLLPFVWGLPARIATAPLGHTLTVVYLGVVPAALAYFCYGWIFSKMNASRASSFLFFTPVAALAIAWIWLGEIPHLVSLLGGALALSGVVVVNRLARHSRVVKPSLDGTGQSFPGIDEPIRVVDYDPCWPERFRAERERLTGALGSLVLGLEHVGSTAVPGLAAKPFVDLLVGVASLDLPQPALAAMRSLGYECLGAAGVPGRVYFRRRAGADTAFNAHFVLPGSDNWLRNVLLRDYLRAHPEEAARYGALKLEIIRSGVDRLVEYGERKRALVDELRGRARAWGASRSNQ